LQRPATLETKKVCSNEWAFAISDDAKQADQVGFPLFEAWKLRNINRINYLPQDPRGTKRNGAEICGILEQLGGAFAEPGGISRHPAARWRECWG
jgi:hypothetical protein